MMGILPLPSARPDTGAGHGAGARTSLGVRGGSRLSDGEAMRP
jgi:hypothetical protein